MCRCFFGTVPRFRVPVEMVGWGCLDDKTHPYFSQTILASCIVVFLEAKDMGIYDFKVRDIFGKSVDMHEFQGKVLLIVNTATGCGFTPQYEGLEALYKKYKDRGFEILDFPCNQFASQAPGSDDDIHEFCRSRYDVTFRQFSKIDVNGDNESPLYTFLKSQKKNGLTGSDIKWNFTKFLVDRDGNVTDRFSSFISPEKIEARIEETL